MNSYSERMARLRAALASAEGAERRSLLASIQNLATRNPRPGRR